MDTTTPAPVMYPTCADYSNTGLWLHLLPATPTGKAACGRVSDEWHPPEAIDATARAVDHSEVIMPRDLCSRHISVLICGHSTSLARRFPHRVATR